MRHRDHLRDDELLHLVDGEAPARAGDEAEAHLAACETCAARRDLFVRLGRQLSAARTDDDAHEGAAHRVRVRAALRAEADRRSRTWLPSFPLTRWAGAAAVVGIAVWLASFVLPMHTAVRAIPAVESDALPVAALTPGATVGVDTRELCAQATRPAQEISPAVRRAVLHDYKMEHVPEDQYELDYLITPELGGAPEARNLWPQRYTARVWNAGVKDQLEDLLPRLVCEGRVELRTAQRDIAADWVAAYRKYFHTATPLRPSTAMVSLTALGTLARP